MKLLHVAYMVSSLLCAYTSLEAQTYFRVTSDSARIVNGELIIGNGTQDIRGVLINKGNGVTEFQKLQLINIGDSAISIAGQDTLQWNGNNAAGEYYILSQNIPVIPRTFYHPLAFEAPLDSGKLYQVHVLIYLGTKHAYDSTSILQSRFSDTIINDQVNTYNVGVDTTGDETRYFLEYNKLIQSKVSKDTFKLYFKTNIADGSGNMTLDSLSYLYVEEVKPKVFSPYYTVDTPALGPLKKDEYYILDSAKFNFTPVAQNVPGWVDVIGDPSNTVITATAVTSRGERWTLSTIDPTVWYGALSNNKSSLLAGSYYIGNDDPFPFEFPKPVTKSLFLNANSEYIQNENNIKISGLDANHLYKIQILGSLEQGYIDDTLLDPDVYATRTKYVLNDNRSHSLNTNSNVSVLITFDTVKTSSSGELFFSVTGQDTTYSKGAIGVINGLKIWDITKDDSLAGSRTVSLFHQNYDTLLHINDGKFNDRLCVVYKPYHYNPGKEYPLLIYLTGQESVVSGDWEPALTLQAGLGIVAEETNNKIYGINANGDTVSFIVLIPQTKLDEWSMPVDNLEAVIESVRSMNLYNVNDGLYIAGFSSGGQAAAAYCFSHPRDVTAAFIQSPAFLISYDRIRDSAETFADNGGHILLTIRGDTFTPYTDTIYKYLYKYSPNSVAARIMNVDHRGFAYEYKLDAYDPVYQGNVYDWLVNPFHKKYGMFYLSGIDARSGRWVGMASDDQPFPRPWNAIMTAEDTSGGVVFPPTRWGSNTIKIGSWDYYATLDGGNQKRPQKYQLRKFYIRNFVMGLSWRAKGSWDQDGPNLQFTGLVPNAKYRLIFQGALDSAVRPGYRTEITVNGRDSLSYNNYDDQNIDRYPQLIAYANDQGIINIGIYPDYKEGATYGGIKTVLIVQDSAGHAAPIVDAGSDQSITLPTSSANLEGSVLNLNSDGSGIVSIVWSIISKPSGTSPAITDPDDLTTTITGIGEIGVYKIELSATDDHGITVRDTMQITVIAQQMAVGDRILIDLCDASAAWFGQTTASPQPDGRYWNNLPTPQNSASYSEIVDTAGTNIASAVISTSGWTFSDGLNNDGATSAVNEYPSTATSDSWIANSLYGSSTIAIKLPAGVYTVKFWGSFTDAGTNIHIAGVKLSTDAAYTTFDEKNNTDFNNAATITMTSDGSTPNVFYIDGSQSSDHGAYINVIDIKKISE